MGPLRCIKTMTPRKIGVDTRLKFSYFRPAVRKATPLLLRALTSLLLALSSASLAVADIVYLYDELGRLVRVIREDGEAATYHYDGVGNILRISRESGVLQAMTVTSSSPSGGLRGSRVTLTIAGTNLVGATVSSPNPGLVFENLRSDPDQLTVDLVIAETATAGPTTLVVTGALGNASLSFTVN